MGRLRTRGVEVESFARISRDLSVSASATYLDAEITEFPFAQCFPGQTAAEGCVGTPARQNLAGKRPPQAPEWKFTGNFTYETDLGSLPFRGVVQGSYNYQTEVNYALSADPRARQDAFGIANLSAGIRDPDGKYELMAFVNNLFDEQYFQNITNSFGNYNNNLATQSYLPRDFRRYVGVRLSYSY